MTKSTTSKPKAQKKPSKSKLALLLARCDFDQITALTGHQFKATNSLQRISEFYATNNIVSMHKKDPIL